MQSPCPVAFPRECLSSFFTAWKRTGGANLLTPGSIQEKSKIKFKKRAKQMSDFKIQTTAPDQLQGGDHFVERRGNEASQVFPLTGKPESPD